MFNCEIKKMGRGMTPSCLFVWVANVMKSIKTLLIEKGDNSTSRKFQPDHRTAQTTKTTNIVCKFQTRKKEMDSREMHSTKHREFDG